MLEQNNRILNVNGSRHFIFGKAFRQGSMTDLKMKEQ